MMIVEMSYAYYFWLNNDNNEKMLFIRNMSEKNFINI